MIAAVIGVGAQTNARPNNQNFQRHFYQVTNKADLHRKVTRDFGADLASSLRKLTIDILI